MQTFLLTYNPKLELFDDLPVIVENLAVNGSCFCRWNCGSTKSIKKGDRIFLIRLGVELKGLIGSGFSISDVFQAEHWNKDKRGQNANYIEFKFDTLAEKPILGLEELEEKFPNQLWSSRSSGIHIKEVIVSELEKLWKGKSSSFPVPSSINKSYPEGKHTKKTSYQYERDPKARRECIVHYGYDCQVCGMNFAKKYGEIGKNYIQVHHIKPLSEVSEEHEVNPIEDLMPVCSNCHSIIHRKSPAFSIEEVKGRINK